MGYLDNTGLERFWAGIKAKLAAKADLASPALTGSPTAPTAPIGTKSAQIATTEYVQEAIYDGTTNTVSGKLLHVTDAQPGEVKSLVLKNSEGETITGKTVVVTNRNLFRIDLIPASSTNKGVTFTKNSDNSITAKGTTTGTYAQVTCTIDKNAFAIGRTYSLSSGKTSGNLYVQVALTYTDGTTDYYASRTSAASFTIKKEVTSAVGSIQITASGVTVNETIYPLLEVGATTSFVNNRYVVITYTGSNLPTLPSATANVWSNDDDVESLIMTYYTNSALANVEHEARTDVLAVTKQNTLAAGKNITIDEDGTISAANDPIDKRTYQNVIASSNTQAEGTFYYAKVTPDDYYTPCRVKVRYRVKINDEMTHADKDKYRGIYQFEVVLGGTIVDRYETYNGLYSTSYRPIYYHTVYRSSQAGQESSKPHYFGISLYSANSPTTKTLMRDFDVEILEAENCSVEMLDELVLQSAFYNATDYAGISNYNAYSQGSFHTGDANSIDRLCYASLQPKAADVSMYGTQLILSADGENYHSITNARNTSLTSSTKNVNQYGFRPEHILYYSSATTVSVGSIATTSTVYESLPFDFRYSYKGNALVAYKPVYLVATYDDSTGLYTPIETGWITQDAPTAANDYYYVLIGYSYNTTSIYLKPEHPVYRYTNGLFKPVAGATKTSELVNDSGFLTEHQDISGKLDTSTFNTAWSQATSAMSDYAIDIEALQRDKANASEIPTKISDLTNDSGFITGYTETDPTVPSWAKASTKPTYTAAEVGADASGTASSAVSSHNSSTTAHQDIRNAIPTNVSQLTNDAGYLTADEAIAVAHITVTGQTGSDYTGISDVEASQIVSWNMRGKTVYADFNIDAFNFRLPLFSASTEGYASFAGTMTRNGNNIFIILAVIGDDVIAQIQDYTGQIQALESEISSTYATQDYVQQATAKIALSATDDGNGNVTIKAE